MHLTNYRYFDYGKPKDPQLEPHAEIKMAQVLGSPMYIYGYSTKHANFWLGVQFPLKKAEFVVPQHLSHKKHQFKLRFVAKYITNL